VVSPGDFVVEDYGRKLFPLSLVDLVLRGDPPQDLDDFLAQPESDGQRSWLSGVEALNDAVARRDAQNGHEVDPGQLDRDHVVLRLYRFAVLPWQDALLLAIALLALLLPVHECAPSFPVALQFESGNTCGEIDEVPRVGVEVGSGGASRCP